METPVDYRNFFSEVKTSIRTAQYEALKAVNKELVGLYWDLGKMISEKQKEKGWGKSVVENLARDLQLEFPGKSGYSTTNLWYMVQLYTEYQHDTILQPMVGELGWSHNIIILSKCATKLEKQFYLMASRKFCWTKRVLEHQIANHSYEKYLLSQTNFDQLSSDASRNEKSLAVKDHYTFDFLGLSEEHSENELEVGLVNHIRSFLLEMGGDYCSIGMFSLAVRPSSFYFSIQNWPSNLRLQH